MAIAPIHFNVALAGDAPMGAPVHFNVAIAGVAAGGSSGVSGLTSVAALSAAVSSVTGTTNPTVLATVALPAIAPGQKLRISIPVMSSVATSKTFNVTLAGVSLVAVASTTTSGRITIDIYNTSNGVQSVDQSFYAITTVSTSTTIKAMALQNASNLVISITPGTTLETDSINGYSVEILTP